MRRPRTIAQKALATLPQIGVVVGLALVIYGVHLWSRPLAYVIGGLMVAAIAFFAGYGLDKYGSIG